MTINVESLPVPVTLRAAVTLTDEELMRFSADNRDYRMERTAAGEITIMSPVGGIGSTHEAYVLGEFYVWTKLNGTGKFFSSACGFTLPDSSCLSPDVAWISLERWNALTLAQQTSFPPLCPDFLVEIRSATDRRSHVEDKMQLWLDNGAKLAWLIDPIAATITIYQPSRTPETFDRPDSLTASEPVAGFTLDCRTLWSPS